MARLPYPLFSVPLVQYNCIALRRWCSTNFAAEKLSAVPTVSRHTTPAHNKLLPGEEGTAATRDIRIVEVAPRDGLQNETQILALEDKITFIELLEKAGLSNIEIASFVNPAAVPQMAHATELTRHFCVDAPRRQSSLSKAVYQGFEAASQAGAKEISVFTATTDSFTKNNIRCTVAESLRNFREIVEKATSRKMRARGYLSCIFDCPYEGRISPARVSELAKELLSIGCYEVSCGDTLGSGAPGRMMDLLEELHKQQFPMERLALHLHDTYGQALANILLAVMHGGVRTIDAAAGGLGGCPFATLSPRQRCTGAAAAAAAATAASYKLDSDARQAGCRDIQLAYSVAASTKAATAAAVQAPPVPAGRETERICGRKTYLQNAVGNVATEEVVYMFEHSGFRTGVSLNELIKASWFVCGRLRSKINSKAAAALWAKQQWEDRLAISEETDGLVANKGKSER